MQVKISVVIPTFKRPTLLTRCLRALLAQTLQPSEFEVIVVSDGPDKDTLIALMPWFKKNQLNLQFLQTPTKKGPAGARNYGWLSARSGLIAFTDDDCIPDRQWLAAFLDNFKQEKLIAFSGQTRVPLPERPTDYALNVARLETAEFITANCACTKPALMQIGGFDESYRAAWREDSDLFFKLLNAQIRIDRIKEAIVVHPVREAPWGISVLEQKKGIYDALLYRKFPKLYRLKIQPGPIWDYYLINLLWLILFLSLSYSLIYLTIVATAALTVLLSVFIFKRLKNSRKSLPHIMEMISTSLVIPTVSVFWRIYGAIKFRIFFT